MKTLTRRILHQVDQWRPYRVLRRPVFILAAPRSGSTFLFDLMCRFEEVWAAPGEVDQVWWHYFPYERFQEPSDHVGGEEYTPENGRIVRHDFYHCSLWNRRSRGLPCGLRDRYGLRRVRYLDKTIANCFHLEFLKKAVPDALYIFLQRDARATVSSMVEGWHNPKRFIKRQLQPFIDPQKSRVPVWCYPAPRGWTKVLETSVEEICAWSWCQHVLTVEEQLRDIPARQQLLLKYEDLNERPAEAASRLAAFCGFTLGATVEEFIKHRPLSRTTVSPPEPDKWQRLHGPQIDRVMPMIGPVMRRWGYQV